MIKIIKPKGSGKTSELIRIAEENHAYIIVANRDRAMSVEKMAKEQGRNILFPVTLEEYESTRFRGSFVRHILIDDADDLLAYMFREVTIDAITMTDEISQSQIANEGA